VRRILHGEKDARQEGAAGEEKRRRTQKQFLNKKDIDRRISDILKLK
jgi:hypothetical protein